MLIWYLLYMSLVINKKSRAGNTSGELSVIKGGKYCRRAVRNHGREIMQASCLRAVIKGRNCASIKAMLGNIEMAVSLGNEPSRRCHKKRTEAYNRMRES